MNSNSRSSLEERKSIYRRYSSARSLSERLRDLEELQMHSYEILRARELNGGRKIPRGWRRWAQAQIDAGFTL